MQCFIPKQKIDSVHSLDLKRLKESGIRGIIFDIDNTLESHRVAEPGQKVLSLIENVKKEGFSICLISNGKIPRVELFNRTLMLDAIGDAKKPAKKNLKRAMQLLGTAAHETALVGDQIFTDVYGGNRMGFYTVLVDPIEQIENKFFYVKRFFERLILKKIKE